MEFTITESAPRLRVWLVGAGEAGEAGRAGEIKVIDLPLNSALTVNATVGPVDSTLTVQNDATQYVALGGANRVDK